MATESADIGSLREEIDRVTTATDELARVADQVLNGTKAQGQSLEDATSSANETAASLKETADQAASVASSMEELASSVQAGRRWQVLGGLLEEDRRHLTQEVLAAAQAVHGGVPVHARIGFIG